MQPQYDVSLFSLRSNREDAKKYLMRAFIFSRLQHNDAGPCEPRSDDERARQGTFPIAHERRWKALSPRRQPTEDCKASICYEKYTNLMLDRDSEIPDFKLACVGLAITGIIILTVNFHFSISHATRRHFTERSESRAPSPYST